jgi:aspartate kinase
MIIVQKYGGSSVADNEKLMDVASKIKKCVDCGNKVVVVVSAQGKTTDTLINKAYSIDKVISDREMDVLLATGEQQSIALLVMTLNKIGIPAISLTGEQAGIFTVNGHLNARINEIRPYRIFYELDKGNVVVVAGFQGVDDMGDITTLGRGGSDTTAVALAHALEAERCDIYSDVTGIYTADPRIVENAIKLDSIDYDVMLELASLGAKVLNNRAVELAKKYNVKLTSSGSFSDEEGTKVENRGLESAVVTGLTADRDVTLVTILNTDDGYSAFIDLAKHQISVDVIGQSVGLKEVSFTVKNEKVDLVKETLSEKYNVKFTENCGKVSIVGCGMLNKPEVAKDIYEALFESDIKVKLISSSEIKFSVIVDSKDVDRALNSIHNKIIKA